MKLFLSSHGTMASGMRESLRLLLGNDENLTVFDAYVNEETVQGHLEKFFEEVPEEEKKILLSDLYGGSVNQIMYQYLDRPNTMLVSGVNLALVLELMACDDVTPKELEQIIADSRESMKRVTMEGSETSADEDEFF